MQKSTLEFLVRFLRAWLPLLRQPARSVLLVPLVLWGLVAQAQVACSSVEARVTPVGPLTLPLSGAGLTLTAEALMPGFNPGGTGFNSQARRVVLLSTGK